MAVSNSCAIYGGTVGFMSMMVAIKSGEFLSYANDPISVGIGWTLFATGVTMAYVGFTLPFREIKNCEECLPDRLAIRGLCWVYNRIRGNEPSKQNQEAREAIEPRESPYPY